VDAVLEGRAELTLKSVAAAVGVTPQALYRHVDSHAQLMNLVLDELTKRLDRPVDRGQSWITWATELAHYLLRLYRQVPGLGEQSVETFFKRPSQFTRMEMSLMIGRRCGLSPLAAAWGTQAVADFVHGWVTREERIQRQERGVGMSEKEAFEAAAASGQLPLLRAALQEEEAAGASRFEFTLEALLVGLQVQMMRISRGL
jgi:AcrR family transcriptional regulator